jgi:transcriptional regulator with XRE-family HTH domain
LQIAIKGASAGRGSGVRLAEWRKQQGWTQDELAGQLDCSQSFVSLIERATDPQIPGRDWMVKIYQLTRGAVAPNDFYELPPIGQLELPIEPSPAPLFDAPEVDKNDVAAAPELQAAA